MSILATFKTKVKKYVSEADERADKRLARAKTSAEREREQAKIQRERLATKREVAEAKVALLKAEASRKRAVKEVKDIGDGVFSSLRGMLQPKKVTRRKTRRKSVKEKEGEHMAKRRRFYYRKGKGGKRTKCKMPKR